jgi:hypothetical protein
VKTTETEIVTKIVLAISTDRCYRHFALESRFSFGYLSRPSAMRRCAIGLVALVVCGFLVPTALAAPGPESPAAPQPLVPAATTPVVDAAPQEAPAPDSPATATATTDQAADATAGAAQQQPTNVVVIVRIDSPGNDGAITQSNVTVATPDAANDATTSQEGGADQAASTEEPSASDQEASTTQEASSAATATQDDAGNLVVTVRIASPGRDGAVTQTNDAVGTSEATNTSVTDQQAAAPAPTVQPQARGKGAANSAKPPRRHRHPAVTAPTAVEPAPTLVTTGYVEPRVQASQATATTAAAAPAPRDRGTSRPATVHHHVAPALSTIAAGAARALSPFVPDAQTVGEAARRPTDLSDAVLLTLATLAAAGVTLVGVRRVPRRRRPISWRARR